MKAVLDDHLLRDLIVGEESDELARLLRGYDPATTNFYLYRLARSVATAAGGALTGSWTLEARRALGARLIDLAGEIEIVPMRELAVAMAEIAGAHRVSTLGAEAIAAALRLAGPLCVWEGDDGPRIRAALQQLGGSYRTVAR